MPIRDAHMIKLVEKNPIKHTQKNTLKIRSDKINEIIKTTLGTLSYALVKSEKIK